MANPRPSIDFFLQPACEAFVQKLQRYTTGVGGLLWIANLALLLNVALIASGTMADSGEFVSALNDNIVVEPFFIAAFNQALSLFSLPTIILVLVGLQVHACATARAQFIGNDQPVPFVYHEYPHPFIQKIGSRAPPTLS